MRIVFFVPYNYKEVGGYRLPLMNHKRELEKMGNEVTFVQLPYHYSPVDGKWKAIKREAGSMLRNADAVFAFPLNQAYIAKKHLLKDFHGPKAAFLADSLKLHEESVLPLQSGMKARAVTSLRKLLYEQKEAYCLNGYDRVIYVSSVDLEYVKENYRVSEKKLVYAPNGTNPPEKACYSDPARSYIRIGMLTDFEPETLNENFNPFFRGILPAIEESGLDYKVVIAGRGANEDMIRAFHENGKIDYLGYVDDLADFYSAADIIFTTVYKRNGIINRILEAWGYGKTVVGYSRNFATFGDALEGVHYLSADKKEDFVRVLREISEGAVNCRSIGENARKLVADNYTWARSTQVLMDSLAAVCGE